MYKTLKPWCLFTVILVFGVIMLGAYTRLKDAGLGCPDWPGCYGSIIAPTSNTESEIIEVGKAWTEMIHRYVAGSLGLLILFITVRSIQLRKSAPHLWPIACVILSLTVFQGLLGMWTVTLRLYPIVVMGHLLGGMAILGFCWLLFLKTNPGVQRVPANNLLLTLSYISILVLSIQIALGGWTSANYAGLVCADFPTCQGFLWPKMDVTNAFNLTAVGIFDSPGIPLENTARVTIQMFHRIGALVTTIVLSALSIQLIMQKNNSLKYMGQMLALTLLAQILLGISNVLAHLPLAVSLLHNAVAAVLLILLITISYKLHAKSNTY